ncbi:DUF86 domain-containing protein [Thermodesulfovibrio sp. 3907-1M]|uniref:DUF86 domain-containing protein n=1 Tax=Thermodesulfovibrio autotrophicus TaxID=3118333 RepID=A0AAU8GY77_9BACT
MIRCREINISKMTTILSQIHEALEEMDILKRINKDDFIKDKRNYIMAEHYLRRAVEGILTIGSHLLSRLGAKTKDYQEIILSLGRYGLIPEDFAEKNKNLAGYRNRLVHIYWEVTPEELYTVINQHFEDISNFYNYYKAILKNPEKYGFNK